MNKLYMMVAIANRNAAPRFGKLFREHNAAVIFSTIGSGTAASELLYYLGLEKTDKLVMFSFVTGETWREIRRDLQLRINIDFPGAGIAFTIPMSSIGGKKALNYLTAGQSFEVTEESVMKETKHELLIVVANQGYSNLVMDAAREAKAGGGTVLHAKGNRAEGAEQFLGVTLAEEKDLILIVARAECKNEIMRSIMEKAGLESKARSVIFSLPVTATAGMRLLELPTQDSVEDTNASEEEQKQQK